MIFLVFYKKSCGFKTKIEKEKPKKNKPKTYAFQIIYLNVVTITLMRKTYGTI